MTAPARWAEACATRGLVACLFASSAGLAVLEYGGKALEAAIRANRLHVITHAEGLEPLRRRFERLERAILDLTP